jgi:hypothetical protein
MSRSGKFDPCRDLFKKLQILTFQYQYIFFSLLFVIKNRNHFASDMDLHNINTRYNYDLHLPSTNLSKGTKRSAIVCKKDL